MDDQKKTFLK